MHVHITCSVILSANIKNKYGSNIAEATTATTQLITPSVVVISPILLFQALAPRDTAYHLQLVRSNTICVNGARQHTH